MAAGARAADVIAAVKRGYMTLFTFSFFRKWLSLASNQLIKNYEAVLIQCLFFTTTIIKKQGK
jgi:hypothetical protein